MTNKRAESYVHVFSGRGEFFRICVLTSSPIWFTHYKKLLYGLYFELYLVVFCQGCVKGCSYYKDCVRCKIYQTGPVVGNCEESCNATIKRVDNVESCKIFQCLFLSFTRAFVPWRFLFYITFSLVSLALKNIQRVEFCNVNV